jgi:MFS family permease
VTRRAGRTLPRARHYRARGPGRRLVDRDPDASIVTRMQSPAVARSGRRSLLPSLLATCLLGAAVAVVGWLLLLLLKGTVVLVAYALGIAMIAVPLLLTRRLLARQPAGERRRRAATVATVVGLGAVLCVAAHLVDEHGWLLVVIPVAAVLLSRLAQGAVGAARRVRRR